MGYGFTGSRISDFPIDSRMGLTTAQRYVLTVIFYKPISKLLVSHNRLGPVFSLPSALRVGSQSPK